MSLFNEAHKIPWCVYRLGEVDRASRPLSQLFEVGRRVIDSFRSQISLANSSNRVSCIHICYVYERARFIDTPHTKENRATAFNSQQERSVWWMGAQVFGIPESSPRAFSRSLLIAWGALVG